MGSWWSRLSASVFKDNREPIKSPVLRIKNLVFNNFRGILGFIVPICALFWQIEKNNHSKTVEIMWMWMFWFFLIQPVAVPATGLIPIFFLPMLGVMSTAETTKCYFNENVALFIISSMLLLLLNNSGFDRRLALWFLCSGDACQFSGKRMVFKASAAAFILSMLSNRLIVTSTITQYVTPIFLNLKSSYGKSSTEPNFDEMRYIINNAIQTSSALGSIAILHAAYATLAFRAIWCEAGPKEYEYPDIFNYLQWTCYALPTAFVMWLFNVCYHMILINIADGSPWHPKQHDTICSEHFIGGKKSDAGASPSYIPTIFPSIYRCKKIDHSQVTARYNRFMTRRYPVQQFIGKYEQNRLPIETVTKVNEREFTMMADKGCQADIYNQFELKETTFICNRFTLKSMSSGTMNEVRTALLKSKQSIPKKMSAHEQITIVATITYIIVFFTRWNQYTNNGWADNHQPTTTTTEAPTTPPQGSEILRMRAVIDDAPVVKDAVVAAMFVIILHLLPKTLNFTNIWRVKKKSEIKEMKPESGILFWRFVDQNTNYGYFFLIGSGIALYWAAVNSGLATILGANLGDKVTSKPWCTSLFLVCLLTCILANVMTGVAALVIFLPLVIIAGENTTTNPWTVKLYLAVLGVAVGSSLGFMFPFMYTPAYFCHHVGKVPILKMVKYSFLSVVVCMLLLWFSLCYWAPYLWDPKDHGVQLVFSRVIAAMPMTTTAMTEAPAPAPGPSGNEDIL